MTELFIFDQLSRKPWGEALFALNTIIYDLGQVDLVPTYRLLYKSLAEANLPDIATAVADSLLFDDSSLARVALQLDASDALPAGLEAGALSDIENLLNLVRRNWHYELGEVMSLTGVTLPPLQQLAITNTLHEASHALARKLQQPDAQTADILHGLLNHYRKRGSGQQARYTALHWQAGTLKGIADPARPNMDTLVGLDTQLAALTTNTETFLAGKPAQHTLLYGPRGSGKSTAVKSLLHTYSGTGLRLVEVFAEDLSDLPTIAEVLSAQPTRFIIFVDDLSFEAGDSRYHPLKTLLEGALRRRPDNILIYATSNRRHLVTERLRDRPDPLDDDVHAWDTQHERLALADRFGLTITFPDANQHAYLTIVHGLAEQVGLVVDDEVEARAINFAKWGNGLSGRVAQQFIDSERARH
ncbi:MAG: ATP-binding protein [Deinococcota bacterium]